MQCEICGAETSEPKKISLDKSTLLVCGDCSSCGTEIKEEAREPIHTQPEPRSFMEPAVLIEGFGKRVQQTRQRKNLTIEELGKKVFEKASLLHRIEHESIKPSPSIVKKLEKELGIKLEENE